MDPGVLRIRPLDCSPKGAWQWGPSTPPGALPMFSATANGVAGADSGRSPRANPSPVLTRGTMRKGAAEGFRPLAERSESDPELADPGPRRALASSVRALGDSRSWRTDSLRLAGSDSDSEPVDSAPRRAPVSCVRALGDSRSWRTVNPCPGTNADAVPYPCPSSHATSPGGEVAGDPSRRPGGGLKGLASDSAPGVPYWLTRARRTPSPPSPDRQSRPSD
ncbi:hypothetical protein CYMTET_29687 [Cymbomonas tetramitiformis]|uniref:Uncharacterized protein n=1 Tax=Cymbomonas tetramitiformis TaxID=36881 RepID=A0AAE0FKB5_9CHLO|nr:hypothetical protein CYMTET_29687 [Cymbomonas tetramitiformis]